MVKVEPFSVEQWMDTYETKCKFNIAETCCASISIDDLHNLSSDKERTSLLPFSAKLTYGAIRGSNQLRENLSSLYSARWATKLPIENVLITNGAIQANFLLHYSLLGPGDHVVCQYPTYQQLYSVPESLGAEVSLWKAKEEDDWKLDINELDGLIQANTKMIILNNPQNPTGASIPKSQLEAIVHIAQRRSIIIHCDEVYRPIFHSISPTDSEFPPSVLTFGYEHTIVTGSMSKAYGLAGIRLGWMASRSQSLIDTCAAARDYTTISVSQLDDSVAAFALAPHCVHNLLQRNIDLAKRNIAILEKFMDTHRWACEWVKPQAGTTAFVKFTKMGRPVDDVAFCKLLIEKTAILLVPGGECFARDGDFKGYIRIGFCCETDVLETGLKKLSEFLKEHLEAIPLASQTTLEIR